MARQVVESSPPDSRMTAERLLLSFIEVCLASARERHARGRWGVEAGSVQEAGLARPIRRALQQTMRPQPGRTAPNISEPEHMLKPYPSPTDSRAHLPART